MPKSKQPIEGQSPLFEGDPSRHMRTWQEIEKTQPSYPTTYGPEGSYVDVSQRASNLTEALDAFGKRNQRLGFDVAAHSRPHRGAIWSRYEEITPVVIEGAQRKEQEFLNQAKRSFWQATGFAAMKNLVPTNRLMDDGEIDARATLMWRRFSEKYGDPNKRQVRDKYKSQLRKAVKNSGSKEIAA